MRFINKSVFILVFLLVLSMILYKLIFVPITHDEVSTVLNYMDFSYWEIIMYPDFVPNNHILNTIFTKLFYQIFGMDVWAVRLQSLIAYFIYSYAVYRVLKTFFSKGSIFVISGIALFFTNPYLLDFFGLCRGYGLAAALVTLSSSYMITGFIKNKDSSIWKAVIFAVLASYANFTVLVYWGAITSIAGVYFLLKYKDAKSILLKRILILAIISILYLLLIFVPIKKITSGDQFRFWSSNGFFKETILTSIDNWRYGDSLLEGVDSSFIGYFTIFLFVLGIVYISMLIVLKKGLKEIFQNKIVVSFMIFVATIFISQVQILLLRTPDLDGRIALFLYPIFIIFLVSMIAKLEVIKYKIPKYVIAIIIPAFLFFHLANTYNPKSVREWWYDENTLEIIDYLKASNPGKEVTLKTYWIFFNSFDFYDRTGRIQGVKLLPNSDIDPNSDADYYYVEEGQIKQLEARYKRMKKISWGRWLLKRKGLDTTKSEINRD